MKRNYFLTRIVPSLLLAMLIVGFGATKIFSQEGVELHGLTISPPITEKTVNKGQVVNLEAKISNYDNNEATLYLSAADFIADPKEGGAPLFLSKPDPAGFSSWVKLPETTVTVRAGEIRTISYTVTVPADADPGSHFGAIIFSRQAPKVSGETEVSVSSEIGSLVFLTLAGKYSEKGEVLSFAINTNKYGIITKQPITLTTRFQNQGNVQLKPLGIVEIFNSANVKQEVLQLNPQVGNVLPDSIRKFENKWDPGKWYNIIPRMGKYTAKGLVTFGNPSQTIELGPTVFWLIPVDFLVKITIGVVATILILSLIIRMYVRSQLSRHNRFYR